jgi:hypothetical protein
MVEIQLNTIRNMVEIMVAEPENLKTVPVPAFFLITVPVPVPAPVPAPVPVPGQINLSPIDINNHF